MNVPNEITCEIASKLHDPRDISAALDSFPYQRNVIYDCVTVISYERPLTVGELETGPEITIKIDFLTRFRNLVVVQPHIRVDTPYQLLNLARTLPQLKRAIFDIHFPTTEQDYYLMIYQFVVNHGLSRGSQFTFNDTVSGNPTLFLTPTVIASDSFLPYIQNLFDYIRPRYVSPIDASPEELKQYSLHTVISISGPLIIDLSFMLRFNLDYLLFIGSYSKMAEAIQHDMSMDYVMQGITILSGMMNHYGYRIVYPFSWYTFALLYILLETGKVSLIGYVLEDLDISPAAEPTVSQLGVYSHQANVTALKYIMQKYPNVKVAIYGDIPDDIDPNRVIKGRVLNHMF